MPTLQTTISEKFFAKLSDSADIDAPKLEHFRTLFSMGKKLKADDLVKIFSLPPSDLK